MAVFKGKKISELAPVTVSGGTLIPVQKGTTTGSITVQSIVNLVPTPVDSNLSNRVTQLETTVADIGTNLDTSELDDLRAIVNAEMTEGLMRVQEAILNFTSTH